MKDTLPDDLIRRMNHREWLATFAIALGDTRARRGAPMTPFILGAITRLQRAARYIELLEKDLVDAEEHGR